MASVMAPAPVAGQRRPPPAVGLAVEGVSKTFGAVTALADVSVRVAAG